MAVPCRAACRPSYRAKKYCVGINTIGITIVVVAFILTGEDVMSIRVLLADDCQPMLTAMRRVLLEESRIEVVAEASTFAATMQAIADFKPEVLVLDLHLPESRNFKSEFVKSQLVSVPQTLAVSFSNDSEAKALAESYGAAALLDKMNLYSEMVPAIMGFINQRQPTDTNSTTVKSTKLSRRAKA